MHYATPNEETHQDESNRNTGNLTVFSSVCCRVYREMFTRHVARKVGVDAPDISSLGMIDLSSTVFDSHCDKSMEERQKQYNDHRSDVNDALGINDQLYCLPAMLNLAIAAQFHQNLYGCAIDVFVTIQVGPGLLGLTEKRGVFNHEVGNGGFIL